MCVFWEGKYRLKNGYTYQWIENEFYWADYIAGASFLYSAEFNPSQSFINFQPNGLSMDNETSFM
jgi:hypothetical protein